MAAPPTTYCRPTAINEIRELAPTADGWAQGEPTGRTCVVCPCGLNTGWIPRDEAIAHRDQHIWPDKAPAPVAVIIDVSGADATLATAIRRARRGGGTPPEQ